MKLSLSLLGAALTLAGMGAAAAGTEPTLHALMKSVVAPETQIVWDTGNNNQDDNGNIDPKKLKDADWSRLASAGEKVKSAMETLAKAGPITVAAPGQKLKDEGSPGVLGAKAIQKLVDSDPKAFAASAQGLASAMGEIIVAAKSHNAVKLGEVSGRLDELCESCHAKFWYPPQK